ncbi:penicillin-binding protein 1A [Longimicrobium terrae]|uniref:Penicillin-binding protein 1A n=1 Tax=Longimicrobium terrae TaxID=1639882 RepID=A0A841H696_9BACT|nr:penicillin-binding protein 1A [Longimicrobium terrae]MBB4639309.1 penicillin-binding protein 1A [Longimicrobium terrae]MBB6073620.1 penicillin-binding protein 1A [Longimicrobium terrae]NNC29374.1 penicillin-binding protein 1A [Longimicrobium terrae]
MRRKLLTAFGILVALGVGAFVWLWFAPCGMGGCAPVSDLVKYQAEGTELFDVNEKPMGTLAGAARHVVPLDSMPDYLPKAVLAVEDRRFYSHGGVDWKRFMGALFRNVKAGGVEEGGSTITMQLARNLFPDKLNYRERSFRRKILEVRVARQIERAFGKDKIMELYLNHIYLGEGAYGVDAAAQTYFGKPAHDLTIAEAALIGGLPQSPSRINPRENREAARTRRDLVLREMAKSGYITPEQAQEARDTPVRVARRKKPTGQQGSYFQERVRRELEELVGPELRGSGLRVYTTLDPVAQKASEEEVARQADAIEDGKFGAYRHPGYPAAKGEQEDGVTTYLQGFAVVMEAQTGAVRALVGGRDYGDSQFDRVYQGLRQPGSAFKPFVYLTGLEQSVQPTTRFNDAPVTIQIAGGRPWQPKNYTGRYDGPITVRDALTRSKNTVTVQLAQQVGMGAVIQTAREMGIKTPIGNNPSTALGSAEVRPIELVSAYAGFANGGSVPTPYVIERVEDSAGEVLYRAEPRTAQVIDPATAFVLTSMLRDVVDRGTGTPVRAAGFRGPAAGKTGTTNGATDIWFVGYTPDLVGAVWFGMDKPQTIVAGASGGTIAAPVWGRIMNRVYQTRRVPAAWAPPRGVATETVDRVTGIPVQAGCPAKGATYTEYFVGSPPAPGMCDSGQYAGMPMDTAWMDEEMGAYTVEPYSDYSTTGYNPDTVGLGDLRERGINFPELEERRRRGDSLTSPLPGSVELPAPAPRPTTTYPAYPLPATPAPPRPRETPPPAPRPETPLPPEPRPTPTEEPRREPRVIGTPVEPTPPAAPDSTGAGRR